MVSPPHVGHAVRTETPPYAAALRVAWTAASHELKAALACATELFHVCPQHLTGPARDDLGFIPEADAPDSTTVNPNIKWPVLRRP